jgi:hypothetical protein
MKRKISYKELRDIIDLMPRTKIEKTIFSSYNKITRTETLQNNYSTTHVNLIDPQELLNNVSLYMRGLHEDINKKQIVKLVVKNTKSF